ncbi:MAG: hypothetical protein Q9221_006963 [Calogaya cf. arnoldii]
MAGIQERLRQMGDLNSDLIEREKGLVRKVDRAMGSELTSNPRVISYRHVKAPSDAAQDQEDVTVHDKDEVSE